MYNFLPTCPYPNLNAGFNDDDLWVDCDCSLKYSDATPSYGAVTAIYTVLALGGFAFATSNFYTLYKRRLAGSAFPNNGEKNAMIMVYFSLMNIFICADPEKRSGLLTDPSKLPYNIISGTMLTAVYYFLTRLISPWAAAITSDFSKTVVVPKWLKIVSYFTILLGFFGEVVVGELVWHTGTISPTSDVLISDVPGMFNPKLKAAKNGIIGLVLLAWFFIAQYYGQRL
ncbi:hypothetical protein TrLO_g5992 [Triparma laevis f. longispina]|uniref:Uncharacterized protein n=1 Tax=Triparma laevis f. longispina TaxID=1714387 RepID=A0A9W7C837_9STRA|nr:hypothetical protein TrLO_g5992 [Triparma laevis f. longispina]